MKKFENSKESLALPPRAPTLAMHGNPHAITKLKPKIRIVHLLAPEIIKTDAANFRELVQRLTGKPAKRTCSRKKKKTLPMTMINGDPMPRCKRFEVVGSQQEHEDSGCPNGVKKGLEGVKLEREFWVESNSGAFLRDMGETDGFLQGLGDDLPLLPLSSSHMDAFGEATAP